MTPDTDMDGPWALPEVTGHPPGMLQDDSRDLSKWLAGKPGAKSLADAAAQTIEATRMQDEGRRILLLDPEPEEARPAPWPEILRLVNEYAMHVNDAANHEAASRSDVSQSAALKALGELRAAIYGQG